MFLKGLEFIDGVYFGQSYRLEYSADDGFDRVFQDVFEEFVFFVF